MSQAVFYFGGYHASEHDIESWVRTAKVQKPTVEFIGFPWPKGASAGADSAVKTFIQDGSFDSAIADIQGNAADPIFIVGHSSGCAIANAVDAGLNRTDNIVLVALDGFKPSDAQLDRKTTQVWGAKCGHTHSRNFPGVDKGRRRIYTATHFKFSAQGGARDTERAQRFARDRGQDDNAGHTALRAIDAETGLTLARAEQPELIRVPSANIGSRLSRSNRCIGQVYTFENTH